MIIKTKVTADELKAVYAERLGLPKSHLVIHKNGLLGFTATLIAGQRDMSVAGAEVHRLTAELRTKYELVDKKTPAT